LGAIGDSLSRLPAHHVARPRLVGLCDGERKIVVEAAGGYGKSVLAAELVDAWGAIPVWVLLEAAAVSAQLLVARLRASVLRAGLMRVTDAMSGASDDPAGVVDAMLASLGNESCAIVIDDAHHADQDAAALIDRIANQLGPAQRLVVLARRLPPGAARLRRAGSVHLAADALALRPEETLELCRRGFGIDVSAEDARALDAATGGWTAATVLAASRAQRAGVPLKAMVGFVTGLSDPLGSILDEALAAPGLDRGLVGQLGRLPLLDRALLADLSGDQDFLDRALAWGLPLTEDSDGWWELPGPVRDHLTAATTLNPDVLRTAARHYERRGRLGTALQMLLAAGESDAAASLVGEADPSRLEQLDPLELVTAMDRVPRDVLDHHPAALLALARTLQKTTQLELRTRFVRRLVAAAERDRSPLLQRAADAELASELMRDGREAPRAAALVRRVLDEAQPSETWTRARALATLGRATIWLSDGSGRVRVEDRLRAGGHLEQAAELYRSLGLHEAAALVAPYRALRIEMALGRPDVAVRVLDEALHGVIGRPYVVASLLRYRAEAALELGRFEDCERDVREVLRIAEQLDIPRDYSAAYAEWVWMHSCSLRGDADGAIEAARAVERRRGDWWEASAPNFFAEAADCLDRVGLTAQASEYLERARQDVGDATALFTMAECAVLARHGDPELAARKLEAARTRSIDPREYWRVTLFEAYAAFRRGDRAAAGLAARALEEAAILGWPQLPLIRERELTEALLGLALQTGLPAPRTLQSTSRPMAISVLGRFELTCGGRRVELAAGQGAQLLKLIAVSGGRVHQERCIEGLWADADPAVGRNRLRVVLSRLRDAAPDVVVREGELIALAPGVRLDLLEFEREVREARALLEGDPSAAVAVARSGIARYRGSLLPHDPYEEWAEQPRERAARSMLDLLDLCATVAADRGDLDEARRLVERTIELAPYDEDRYLHVALILHRQGRKGAALSVLRRARSALAQMGMDPPRALGELERRIAVRGPLRGEPRRVTAV
jgi:LuxR family transcriptional regulator, maltose regulon positive regulatory protein